MCSFNRILLAFLTAHLAVAQSSLQDRDLSYLSEAQELQIRDAAPGPSHSNPSLMVRQSTSSDSNDDDDTSSPSVVTTGPNITITDVTATLQLQPGADGNLNLTQSSSAVSFNNWATQDNVVSGDTNGRYLIYYPNVMQEYGVSRIRLAAWGSIPIGATLITLSQITVDGNNSMFLAVDTLGNSFYPVVCLFSSAQTNKVFLSSDASAGLTTLADSSLRYTVTGGVVDECSVLALNSSAIATLA